MPPPKHNLAYNFLRPVNWRPHQVDSPDPPVFPKLGHAPESSREPVSQGLALESSSWWVWGEAQESVFLTSPLNQGLPKHRGMDTSVLGMRQWQARSWLLQSVGQSGLARALNH